MLTKLCKTKFNYFLPVTPEHGLIFLFLRWQLWLRNQERRRREAKAEPEAEAGAEAEEEGEGQAEGRRRGKGKLKNPKTKHTGGTEDTDGTASTIDGTGNADEQY